MSAKTPLTVDQLCFRCDTGHFDFENTGELEDFDGVIGQPRAVDAIRFGIGIQNEGYNLYLLGRPGVGKHTAALKLLRQQSGQDRRIADWCYVNNFKDAVKPNLLCLPVGKGAALAEDILHLVEELRATIPAIFDSEDYNNSLREIEQDYEEREQQAFEDIHGRANEHNIRLVQRRGVFSFVPLKDGKVIEITDFQKLPETERAEIEKNSEELQKQLEHVLNQDIPQWRKERRERIRDINRQFTSQAIGHLIASLQDKYRDLPDVVAYLEAIEQDAIDRVAEFRQTAEDEAEVSGDVFDGPFQRYRVNLLIDNSGLEGAPIVYEDNPTYPNLLGRVEHVAQFGTLLSDFTLIRPGALHRANGGYLLLDAHKVLVQPFAWEGLKRALFSRELKIESLGQALSLVSTVSLEPDPMPLDVKVVLMGDRLLYYLLSDYDPEFRELFKVAADFDDVIERSTENYALYARVLATLVRKAGLRHLRNDAVAAVIEHTARLAADDAKLSMHMRSVDDLLAEANYWAGERDATWIEARDVQRAIDAQIHRVDRVRERLYEEIEQGILQIHTRGAVVAQINGLSVIHMGQFAFGLPSRITATTRLGDGEVVDIEREVDLGGPIHSKGVFILSSFLGARYAADFPLSLAASLSFEQSYSGVEGDSASLAELCALLSSLANAPLAQNLAVTGSVDQRGTVQAIGGVNEKIEGFFTVCQQQGLDGTQGVIIPASNVPQLMLNKAVREAAEAGQFAIYSVQTVDEAMELLTGLEAGVADPEGAYPDGSLNGLVQQRLEKLAQLRHAYGSDSKDDPQALEN